jgi:type II secretory pathway pseudopilin PulG
VASHSTSFDVMRASRGFTYLGLLFALALFGMALAAAGTVWSLESRRQREQQLLWTGDQYRAAIARYFLASPGGLPQYPRDLAELLEDHRGPVVHRHLRKLYADPMTGVANWEIIHSPEGYILGVASKTHRVPIKKTGFEGADKYFVDAACYCDWRFVYLPQLDNANAGSPAAYGVQKHP